MNGEVLRVGLGAVLIVLAAAPLPARAAVDTACRSPHLALVIGNAAYPDNEVPLKGSVESARRVARALRDLGYETAEQENLSRVGMKAALDALVATVTPRSTVFLFYSGLAIQSGKRDVLLPVDASIWSEADIATNGIALEKALAEIVGKGARAALVAIDAGRRNPFERRFRPSGSAGLAPIVGIENLAAILATPPDAVFDPSDTDATAFAEDLALDMAASGASAESAFAAVQAHVAKRLHGGQTPWTASTLARDLPLDAHDCTTLPAREARLTTPDPPRPPPRDTVPAPDAAPAPPVLSATPPARADSSHEDARLESPRLLDEVRDRLFEQGLDTKVGDLDHTEQAVRAYEKRAGLPPLDYPTEGVLRSLRDAASLKPWGAIAFAAGDRRWGMAWGSPTRQQALAVAKARCGANGCEAVSFFGQRCGAFALSPKGWSLTWRVGSEPSRKAALDECGRHGDSCRLVGAVCADGSEKTKGATP